MKNALFVCLWIWVTLSSVNAQLIPIKQNSRWGFIDTSGDEQIPIQYREVFPFSDGIALVRKEGQYQYIDTRGKAIIPQFYDEAYGFQNGMAIVYSSNFYRLIDTAGKTLLKWKADKVTVTDKFVYFYRIIRTGRYSKRKTNIRRLNLSNLTVSKIKRSKKELNLYRNYLYLPNGYYAQQNSKKTECYLDIYKNDSLVKRVKSECGSSFVKSYNFILPNTYFSLLSTVNYYSSKASRSKNLITVFDTLGNKVCTYESPAPVPNKTENDKYIISHNRLFQGVNATHYVYMDSLGNILCDSIAYFSRNSLSSAAGNLVLVKFLNNNYVLIDRDGAVKKRLPNKFFYLDYDNASECLTYGNVFDRIEGIVDCGGNIIFSHSAEKVHFNYYAKNVMYVQGKDSSWIVKKNKEQIWATSNAPRTRDTLYDNLSVQDELDFTNDSYASVKKKNFIAIQIDTTHKTYVENGVLSYPIEIKKWGYAYSYKSRERDYSLDSYIEIKNKNGRWKRMNTGAFGWKTESDIMDGQGGYESFLSSIPVHKGVFKTQMRLTFVISRMDRYYNDIWIKTYHSNVVSIGINPRIFQAE